MLILNILTFANLVLLFALLFFRKDNALPNRILALLLINPGINFISNVNILSGNFFNAPYVYFVAQLTCFGFAPLVHMYVRLLIGKKIDFNSPLYAVTGVFMLITVYFAIEFAGMPLSQQRDYMNGVMHEPYPLQMTIVNSIFIIMQQVYFTVSAMQVYRYRKTLPDIFSSYDKTKVTYVTKFISLIWILNFITIGLYISLPSTQVEYVYLPLVLTVIYFFILYYGFHYHSIFTHQSYESFVKGNVLSQQDVVPRSSSEQFVLDAETILLAKQVDDFIDENQLFTNPDLTIELLAKEIDIPLNRISHVINKGLKKNFFDLINEKRVEKSKVLLAERSGTITIEYVAYESGFNSRASFYRAFKKYLNSTPKDYLKSIAKPELLE